MKQLREFAQKTQDFEAQNVRIVAISSDDVEHAKLVWNKLGGKFTILSDPGAKVITQYGLLHAHGYKDEDIAIRTSLLVDEQGNEVFRRVSSSVMETPSVDEILAKIRQH